MNILLEPFDLHGLKLKNRIIMAPMTRSRASADNVPSTSLTPQYYAQRAGAGLIISEATAVSKQGCGYPNIPGLWNKEQVAAWKKTTEAVHKAGGKIFAQLFHTGRIAHSTLTGSQPVSSGAKTAQGQVMAADYSMKDYETPRVLDEKELPGVVEQFRAAVTNAKEAGFDGVEIHSANGYLLDQFLRDGTNTRKDSYGGAPENRARLMLEVVRAAVEVFGAGRVGVRLSPVSDFNSMGDSNPSETFIKAATLLNALPIAYLHVIEPATATPHVAGAMRKAYKGVFILNGGLNKESGEKIVKEATADLACYGVPYIANPDLAERFQKNLPLAQADPATFYAGGEKGYVDYPKAA